MSFTDWEDDCSAEIAAALTAMTNPASSGMDPRNPYRRNPATEQIPLQLSLEQFYDGVWYEQRLHLAPEGFPRGKQRSGSEASTMEYTLQDIEEPSCITFRGGAVKGQRVRLTIGNDVYFKGTVESSVRVAYHQYADLSDRCRYRVTCVDESPLLHRVPIFEIIRNTTEGGMVADLLSRYCPEFDISGINVNFGDTIEERIIGGQYLDEIIAEVLQNNPNGAFWLDITCDPTRPCLDDRNSPDLLLPVEITDVNLYGDGNVLYPGFCRPGEWSCSPSDKTYRNSIILRAPLLINTGFADFKKDMDIVLGTSNQAGWHNKVFPGMKIRKTGSNSSYTVKEVHTSGPPTPIDDIRIQGAYQEDDATAAAYEIIGDEYETIAEDWNEISRRAAMSGQVGTYAGLVQVIVRVNTPLTEDEADRYAELLRRTWGWEGFLKTDNRKFPVLPAAGKILRHNAPMHDVIADIPIAELDWQVKSGYAPPKGGVDAAWVAFNISFTDRAQFTDNALLQMLLRERHSKIRDYDKLTVNKMTSEQYLIKACVHATEGKAVDEKAEYSDSITATDISELALSGPWYPWPGTPYDPPIIAIDADDPSTYWQATPV